MRYRKLFSRVLATAFLLTVVTTGIVFAIRQGSTSSTNGKITLTASYYPLYDFARQVGGDKIAVTDVTPSGVEPHEYEPSPKVLADARDSDVFVYNGIIEPWADSFVQDYKNIAVNTSHGIAVAAAEHHENEDHDHENEHNHGSLDPHFWLDPVRAQHIISNIRKALVKADPENEPYYTKRAADYIAQLRGLDEDFRTGLRQCRQHSIVASHDAFSYVAARYGFTVEPIAGISPEVEPSPARLAEISDYVRRHNIKYIFFEQLVSSRLAATIAQETGAQTSVLNPIEGLTNEDQAKGRDYLSIQRENLGNLRTALACD